MTHAAQFVLTHGALVLFLWILIQQIGLPIPSAPLLISSWVASELRTNRLCNVADGGSWCFFSGGQLLVSHGAEVVAVRLPSSNDHRLERPRPDSHQPAFGWSAGSVKICWYLEFGFASGEARASLSSAVSAL